MIERRYRELVELRLRDAPGLVLLGPRQVGKTTLALEVAQGRPSVYLDLESATDRAKLADAGAFLDARSDHLVILDEVHRMPELFQELRGSIDRGRRAGVRAGRFLLLGSASMELLRQSESLAGRVSYVELPPIGVTELRPDGDEDELWVRGGFPDSLLAPTGAASLQWRRDIVRAYLEREVPMFAPRIPAEALRRLWTMLAHTQGAPLNASLLARSLDASPKTVTAYIDLLADLLLVRRLAPWSGNVGKRLVRSPKVYVRDSGLLHALLEIPDLDSLLGHPVAGASWEGHAIENIIGAAPAGSVASYYRTAQGAELDLIIELPGGKRWAFEIKRTTNPSAKRGLHEARAVVEPDETWIVTPGTSVYELPQGIHVSGLRPLVELLWGAN